MKDKFEADTRLRGGPLWAARIVWLLLVGSILVMFCIVAYENLFEPLSVCESNACAMTPAEYAAWQAAGIHPEMANLANVILFGLLMPLLFFFVAAVIAWRRSDDWMGLLVSFALVGLGPYLLAGVNLTLRARPEWSTLTAVLQATTVLTFGSLFYLFPNGRVVPRWARWLLLIFGVMVCAGGIVDVTHMLDRFGAAAQEQSDAIGIVLFFVVFVVGLGAQVYRYRRVSDSVQRQQTKWVIAGLLGPVVTLAIWFAIFPMIAAGTLPIMWGLLLSPLMAVLAMALPVSIGFAMLRYRLWDIDIIIRRTVTYAIVVALLLIVYFGSVILLQQLFATITGERSEVITVLSTLVIAALFIPLRSRVQSAIDKRFNRKKYDAQQVLQKFAVTVRDETDLEKLSAELLGVVNETMQPKSMSLWLKQEKRGK